MWVAILSRQINTLIYFSIRQNLRKIDFFFIQMFFIRSFDFTFQGIIYCDPISCPQSNELFAGNFSKDTKNCALINFTINLFFRGGHIISILQNSVQEKFRVVGGYYEYFVFFRFCIIFRHDLQLGTAILWTIVYEKTTSCIT